MFSAVVKSLSMPNSYIGMLVRVLAPRLLIQLVANAIPGRKQKVAEVLGVLSPPWETQIELLASA